MPSRGEGARECAEIILFVKKSKSGMLSGASLCLMLIIKWILIMHRVINVN